MLKMCFPTKSKFYKLLYSQMKFLCAFWSFLELNRPWNPAGILFLNEYAVLFLISDSRLPRYMGFKYSALKYKLTIQLM